MRNGTFCTITIVNARKIRACAEHTFVTSLPVMRNGPISLKYDLNRADILLALLFVIFVNKREENLKRQSKMDNAEAYSTLSIYTKTI
jgi:hypothetical protein